MVEKRPIQIQRRPIRPTVANFVVRWATWLVDYWPACVEPEEVLKIRAVAAAKTKNAVDRMMDIMSLSWLPPGWTAWAGWPPVVQLPFLRPFDVCQRWTNKEETWFKTGSTKYWTICRGLSYGNDAGHEVRVGPICIEWVDRALKFRVHRLKTLRDNQSPLVTIGTWSLCVCVVLFDDDINDRTE